MAHVSSERFCPVCGSEGARRAVAQLRGCAVFRCMQCASDSVDPLPSSQELERAYQGFDAGELARKSFEEFTVQARRILAADFEANGLAVPGNSIDRFLDYGCGGGHFVRAAADLGYAACGIDLDRAPSEFGRQHGLDIRTGTATDIEDRFGPHPFNVILMMHVLEHAPYPRELLQNLARRLAPGGCLFIGVPDQASFPSRLKIFLRALGLKRGELGFVQPPIHLHGFRGCSFRAIADAAGLQLVSVRKTGPLDPTAFPSSDLYWKGLALQRGVYALGRAVGSEGHLKVVLRRAAG